MKYKYHRKPHLELVNMSYFIVQGVPFGRSCVVYLSSICQERAAACRQCSHRLCLVNSTSDIHETAEGCRSTEIEFRVVVFFLHPPPSFFSQTTKQHGMKTAVCVP